MQFAIEGVQATNLPQLVRANRFAGLQAAVNSLPTSGGTILVPCGTFRGLVIAKPNVRLLGAGDCSIITAPASGVSNILTVTNRATGVIISNLQIQGQAVDQSTTQRCVYLTGGSKGTTIQHVRFAGTSRSNGCNIQIHSDSTSSRNLITDNTLTQVIGTLSGGGYGMLIETSDGNIIKRNVSVQTASQGRAHIYLSAGSSFNVVEKNRLTGGTIVQIEIYAKDTQPSGKYNLIRGNTLTAMSGARVLGAAISLVQNVTLNRVIENRILSSRRSGIEVEASSIAGQSRADSNDIENNAIYFAGQFGILLLGPSNTMVRGNDVYEASQTDMGEYAGIAVVSYGPATAVANRILGNTSYGSIMQSCALRIDSSDPKPYETLVEGNQFGQGVLGDAFEDNGANTVIGNNVLNYFNPNPPTP
jgi:hypothetical protein